MKKILVLCTGNSCRSQIAEAFLRRYSKDKTEIFSAGIETHGVNPLAVQTMKDIGIDISNHTSNNLEEYSHLTFDFVITVCDNAKDNCPIYPSKAKKFHQNFKDPASATGTMEEKINEFSKVRDEIDNYCRDFVLENL